jgi:hypothetical protein
MAVTLVAGALGGLCAARPALADGACGIAVDGAPIDRWVEAAAALDDASAGEDCARVAVHVDGARATLVFVTREGRRAERSLEDQDELRPTVEALRITVPAAEAAAPAAAPAADNAPAKAPTTPAGPRATASPATDAGARPGAPRGGLDDFTVRYGVEIGARAGVGALISPVLEGFGSLAFDRWELGVLGRWEGRYKHLGERKSAELSAVVVGLTPGRREPLGETVEMLFGGSAMLAAIHDERDPQGATTAAQVRVGGYLGMVLPRKSSTRARAVLATEIAPQDIGSGSDAGSLGPGVPWWALSLSLGVEMGGP